MTNRVAFRLTLGKALFLASSTAIGLMGAPQAPGVQGPGADSREAFEVASVRLSRGEQTGGRGSPSGACSRGGSSIPRIQQDRFVATTSLYALIAWAYGKNCVDVVANGLISGGPRWVTSDQFQIQAIMPAGTPQYTINQLDDGRAPRLQMMIQSLLADRFHLTLHREGRDVQSYDLTIAAGGAKLRPFKEGSCDSTRTFNPQWLSLPRERWPCGTAKLVARETITSLEGLGIDLVQFSNLVIAALGRKPVIDKTGLTGKFDFHLEFANDETTPRALMGDAGGAAPATLQEPRGPSIFAAIQELGLKLEPSKTSSERLVIDSVEPPTDN